MTSKITDSCPCGAELSLEDPVGRYILNGVPDNKGRRYCIERIYSEWLEAHKPCREKEKE
jgi:hypothetical protein